MGLGDRALEQVANHLGAHIGLVIVVGIEEGSPRCVSDGAVPLIEGQIRPKHMEIWEVRSGRLRHGCRLFPGVLARIGIQTRQAILRAHTPCDEFPQVELVAPI